jgi:hypothetical protein
MPTPNIYASMRMSVAAIRWRGCLYQLKTNAEAAQ